MLQDHVSLKEKYHNFIKNISKNRVYQFYIVVSLTFFDLGLFRVAKSGEVGVMGIRQATPSRPFSNSILLKE